MNAIQKRNSSPLLDLYCNKLRFTGSMQNSVVKIQTAESRRLEGVLNRGSEYRDGTQTPAAAVSYRQARDGRTVV